MASISHEDCDVGAMREAGDAPNKAYTAFVSGFTAINQPSLRLQPSDQLASASLTQQVGTRVNTSGGSCRRRNPTVASYLGLDDLLEPPRSLRFATTLDGPSLAQPKRKRRATRNGKSMSERKKTNMGTTKTTDHAVGSESSNATRELTPNVAEEDGYRPLPTPVATIPVGEQREPYQAESHDDVANTLLELRAHHKHTTSAIDIDSDDDFGQLCINFEPQAYISSNTPTSFEPEAPIRHAEVQVEEVVFDDNFDDDLVDEDLLELTREPIYSTIFHSSSVNEASRQFQTADVPDSSTVLLHVNASSSSPLSKHFVSPVTPTTRIQTATGNDARKPIVRTPFPTRVLDRSPIIGMSSNSLLRTCFRVGEAINQSCQAVKTGGNIMIELYARVLSSERDELQQRFTFCDLFHAKPPYVQGTYAAAIWKSVDLFEFDSSRLLQAGRLCRCMGKMKRNGNEWTMIVLNIWEATWDDVEWVEGIINS